MTPQEIQIVSKAHTHLGKLNHNEMGFIRSLFDNLAVKRRYPLSPAQAGWLHSIDEKLCQAGFVHGGPQFTTISGKVIDFLDLKADLINIWDIAHGLSNVCRFGGQCKTFYSVAAHSMRVAELVPSGEKLAALLHDATEAYLGDMVTPVKRLLPDYRRLESSLWRVIAERFLISEDLSAAIKEADQVAFEEEATAIHQGLRFNRETPPLNTASGKEMHSQFMGAFLKYGGKE